MKDDPLGRWPPAVKYNRAVEHARSLNAAVSGYLEGSSLRGLTELQATDDWQEVRWHGIEEPPDEWGLILGDLVHNARSTLDYLVYQAAVAGGATRPTWTQFPITESESKWDDITGPRDDGRPMLDSVPAHVRNVISELQPFRTAQRRKADDAPLMILQRLANTDKHRLLHVGAIVPAGGAKHLRIEPREFFAIEAKKFPGRGYPIKNGAKFCDLKLRVIRRPPPDVHMLMKFELRGSAVFLDGDTEVAKQSDIPDMLAEVLNCMTRIGEALGQRVEPGPPIT